MSTPDPQSIAPLPEEDLAFGAFRLIRELGRGGMGTVYLAEVREEAFEATVDTATEIGDIGQIAHRPARARASP